MENILRIDGLTVKPIEDDGYLDIFVYDEYTFLNKEDILELIEFLQKQLEK